MIYQYTNENLSKEEIQNLLKESKTVIGNIKNLAYYSVTFFLVVFIMISFIHYGFKWTNKNFIIIIAYVAAMCIVFFSKKVNLKSIVKKENEEKVKKQSIEIRDGVYIYRNDKFGAMVNKETVLEVNKTDEYTVIFLAAKRLKSIISWPIFIPNNLFKSEEIYKEFIEKVSKK